MKIVLSFLLLIALLGTAWAACPFGFIYHQVNATDIEIIVAKHNELRLQIAQGKVPKQPEGINLKKIKWDKYLGEWGQKIVDNCTFKHVGVPDKRFYVGQNLYAWSASYQADAAADWNSAIQVWFNEYLNYDYNDNKGAGHYTQVIWANTEYVGCGYAYYKSPESWYDKLYVCNYGPGGNYVGAKPYAKIGDNPCRNLC